MDRYTTLAAEETARGRAAVRGCSISPSIPGPRSCATTSSAAASGRHPRLRHLGDERVLRVPEVRSKLVGTGTGTTGTSVQWHAFSDKQARPVDAYCRPRDRRADPLSHRHRADLARRPESGLQLVTGLQELGHADGAGRARGRRTAPAREGRRCASSASRRAASSTSTPAGSSRASSATSSPTSSTRTTRWRVALAAMALQMSPRLEPRPLLVAARRVDFHLKRHAFSKWKYRQSIVFIAASERHRRHPRSATASRAIASPSSTTASTSA